MSEQLFSRRDFICSAVSGLLVPAALGKRFFFFGISDGKIPVAYTVSSGIGDGSIWLADFDKWGGLISGMPLELIPRDRYLSVRPYGDRLPYPIFMGGGDDSRARQHEAIETIARGGFWQQTA